MKSDLFSVQCCAQVSFITGTRSNRTFLGVGGGPGKQPHLPLRVLHAAQETGSVGRCIINSKMLLFMYFNFFFFFFFFCVPQLYLWGSPLLGEIFAYETVF